MLSYENGNHGEPLGPQLASMHLQWFAEIPVDGPPLGQPSSSEPPASVPVGQPVPAAPATPKGKEPAGAPAPGKGKQAAAAKAFFEHTAPDGRKHTFESPEALSEAMKKSFMLQSDYSRKTKEIAEQAAKLRQREQEMEKIAKSNKELEGKYTGFRKFMEGRPDLFKQLSEQANLPPSPEEAYQRVMGEVKTLFDDFRNELKPVFEDREERRFREEQEQVFSSLAEEIPDLDRKSVEEMMANVAGDTPALIRLVWDAIQHRNGLQAGSPEAQQAAAEANARKKVTRVLPGGSLPAAPKSFDSIQEARKAAHADARARGEE